MNLAFGVRCCAAVLLLLGGLCSNAQAEGLAEAQQLLLRGNYAEAQELYTKLLDEQAVPASLGIARCQAATGKLAEANETLTKAVEKHPDAADLRAELARLAFDRGDYKTAEEQATAALKHNQNQLLARWIQAELFRVTGRLDEANEAYQWFVNYYNSQDEIKDPEALHRIGLAAGHFARWNRLSDQFSFLVNELYPDALKLDKSYWPAHYEAGRLFLEKYNERDASKEFKAGLVINAQAAELHVATAMLAVQNFEIEDAQSAVARALEINPQLLAAHQLQADIHLANLEVQQAAATLEKALTLNPVDEETLGRLTAAYLILDGAKEVVPGSRAAKIVDEVNARNPHAGAFYQAIADAFDKTRRFPMAAYFYAEATKRMPQLTASRGQLGMMLMRLGDEEQAKQILTESFDIDPFNVRVSNTLKVLEVLDDYETLETEHFIIKYDPKYDKIFARYAARWLEEVYPELCQQLGYEPPEKSLFEFFNRAKNTDGHGWFSARMVGLPHIHTIGACAGKMVAMQSPTEGKQRFNWARVLKHEFVHVVNLQQTNFNIPHWYTEALAVLNEGYPRPESWNVLLLERVPAGKIFNLDTINLGFIRPHSSDDWTMAYCQAELYAEYMLEKYGADALSKMLAAYADNATTKEALQRSFGVEQADFEAGYREYLNKVVSGISAAAPSKAAQPMTLVQIEKALEDDPENADLLAELARAYLNRRKFPDARKHVDAALKANPKQPLAAYVRARLHLVVGEEDEALKLLEGALDESAPQGDLLGLLASLRLKAENYTEAARLYELGAKHEPADSKWTKALAVVYLKSGEQQKLAGILAKLAESEEDDPLIRKKLAELALAEKDYEAAARWANQALHIDVMDMETHRFLGEALLGKGDAQAAAEEYEVALEIKPADTASQFGLAQAYAQSNQGEKARAVLEKLLESDADYPGAESLLESLQK